MVLDKKSKGIVVKDMGSRTPTPQKHRVKNQFEFGNKLKLKRGNSLNKHVPKR